MDGDVFAFVQEAGVGDDAAAVDFGEVEVGAASAAAGATQVVHQGFEPEGAGADFFFEFALDAGFGRGVVRVHEAGDDFVLPGVFACDHGADAELFDEDDFFAHGVVWQGGDDVVAAAEAFAFDVFEHTAAEAFVGDLVAADAEEVVVGFFAVLDVVVVVHAVGSVSSAGCCLCSCTGWRCGCLCGFRSTAPGRFAG